MLLAMLSRANAALARVTFDEFVVAMGDTDRGIKGNGYVRGEWAKFTLTRVAYTVGSPHGEAILAVAMKHAEAP